ncbi:carbonic anhydrase, putative [Phytophthora infestans T30-4]|uniref:Carbonic anhydrase n=1 Tax=Phytophthora infestans (strain T30-4) TaxID=403677 RepID=D0MRE4_PHYIT|nr:carbonic anhydrase, putative [Phytophthora infestans T30-4]EEY58063.1 carbonic anhydrase, putative [Phytophthora infestans T30-4]|eukprot:XP_002909249.1 carbonic anhydrase, putative [Phytophthora infestans T30-4]
MAVAKTSVRAEIIIIFKPTDQQDPSSPHQQLMSATTAASTCLGECKGTGEEHFHSSKSIQHLLDNNKKWREELMARDSSLFDRTADGQHPPYLWIGCSDSRVPAEEITGLDPGEMFCHRNVANLVVTNDINVLSVVQYAVEALMVKDIIVCGHYGCGGVKAAIQNKHIGILDTWLRSVRDVHRNHKEELDALPTEEARYRRTVELNVKQQCLNIFKTNVVQHRLGRPDQPGIHGLVYDVKTGALKELKVDYCGYYAKLIGEDSLHAFPDGEPTMGLAHRRRNLILDLPDGLEREPGLVRIRYMARMLKRESELFSPEEVDEAIETIKGQMDDPNNSFMNVKHLIAYFAPMKPKEIE